MRLALRSLAALILTLSCSRAARPELRAQDHAEAAGRLIGAALVQARGHERLGVLCDRFGHRLSGSQALEDALRWAADEMRADGFDSVELEPVDVPAWVRGRESARVTHPVHRELTMLGLGGSVGTPPGGVAGDLVVVSSYDELEALGVDGVTGRVVLYEVPFTTYGETVRYRTSGASRAAALGARAALVRSVGPKGHQTPHTGALRYSDDAPRIPAAALSAEHSAMLARMARRGRVAVQLDMEAHELPDARSANLVAELHGRELPHEIVTIGGHLDSWDVGQGAQDDGVGCLIAWEAARLMIQTGLRPRRTVRVVLFTNEENGLRGAREHARLRELELENHVAAIESDSGNGQAAGFRVQLPPARPAADTEHEKARAEELRAQLEGEVLDALQEIAPLLAPVGASRIRAGGSGADVGPLVRGGVLGMGLDHDTSEYFRIHHTPADTFDKVDREVMNRNIAAMAVMTHVLAEMPGRLVGPRALAPSEAGERASFSRR